MPVTLTLAEFKTRLAVESSRRALGIDLSDAEALRVVVDDQQVAELYVQWRSGAFTSAPAPQPTAPPSPPATQLPFYRRPAVVILGVAAVVVLLVVGAVGFNALGEQLRKQQFAEILSENPNVTENLRNLEGDSLDATFNVNCEKIRDGWTRNDQVDAAVRNWEAVRGTADITEAQWMANNMASFDAAMEVCG